MGAKSDSTCVHFFSKSIKTQLPCKIPIFGVRGQCLVILMDTFSSIINSTTPVLVDFYATWCGPCKAMSPAIEAIGKEVQGKARVLKIDVDKNQALAARYQIQAVPTLMIFKNGKVLWKQSGGMDKSSLKNILLSYV
jgi:thioredoxin 1